MSIMKSTYVAVLRGLGLAAAGYGQSDMARYIDRVADGLESTSNVNEYMQGIANNLEALHAAGNTFNAAHVNQLIADIDSNDDVIEAM